MEFDRFKSRLGLEQPSIKTINYIGEKALQDNDLGTFYKPVNVNYAFSDRTSNTARRWFVGIFGVLTAILVIMFLMYIMPSNNYNSIKDSLVVVDGKDVNQQKIKEAVKDEEVKKEELQVQNIIVANIDEKSLAKNSPLLASKDLTLVEYRIRRGDTLDRIAGKFYDDSSPSAVKKIMMANKIRNPRLIQVGQKIIVPM